MKTMEELYKEVMASEVMRKEFLEASRNKEKVKAFLKKFKCEATVEELSVFLKEKEEDSEICSEDILRAIAGGSNKTVVIDINSVLCNETEIQ